MKEKEGYEIKSERGKKETNTENIKKRVKKREE